MNSTYPAPVPMATDSYTDGLALALIAVWLTGLFAVIRQTKNGVPWTAIGTFTQQAPLVEKHESRWEPVPNVLFSMMDVDRLPTRLRNRAPVGFNAAAMEVRHYPSGKCAFRIALPDGHYYFGREVAERFAVPAPA